MITEKELEKYLKEVDEELDFDTRVSDLFDTDIISPCAFRVVDLLERMFLDEDGWIRYFVFDLDLGRDYRNNHFTAEDGSEILLDSVHSLYTLLMDNMTAKESAEE